MCRERDSDAAIGGLVRDRERERVWWVGLGWVGLSTYSYSYRERESVECLGGCCWGSEVKY